MTPEATPWAGRLLRLCLALGVAGCTAVVGLDALKFTATDAGQGGAGGAAAGTAGAAGRPGGAGHGGAGGGGGGSPECDAAFGDSEGYDFCWQESDVCAFRAKTDPAACNDICQAGGGTCVEAHYNSNHCEVSGSTSCDDDNDYDLICHCRLP